MVTLFPWQEPLATQLLSLLHQHRCVVNALPMGAGKTFIASWVAAKFGAPETWILSPKSVRPTWEQVAKEVPNSRFLHWELLARQPERYQPCDGALLIADEFHRFLIGRSTKSGDWLLQTFRRQPSLRVLLQSATPFASPLQMRYSGALLGLHNGGVAEFLRWCRMNGCRLEQFRPFGRAHLVFPSGSTGQIILRRIQSMIQGRLLCTPLSEIPGYPPLHVQVKLLEAQPEDGIEEPESLTSLGDVQLLRHRLEQLRVPFMVEQAKEGLDLGYRILLFCAFRDTAQQLAQLLQPAALIIGEQNDREQQIRRFQSGEVPVCVCTLGAGGVGISLHDTQGNAPRLVLAALSFDAAEMVQAAGRAFRVGTRSPVLLRFLIFAGTFEERIYRAVRSKVHRIDLLAQTDWKQLFLSLGGRA